MDIEGLKDELAKGVVVVTFTKKDGTERIMRCTWKSEIITRTDWERKTEKVPNPDVCAVFDVDICEWRSFRYDSIINYRIEVDSEV